MNQGRVARRVQGGSSLLILAVMVAFLWLIMNCSYRVERFNFNAESLQSLTHCLDIIRVVRARETNKV